mgnify:CR=1 FL=1
MNASARLQSGHIRRLRLPAEYTLGHGPDSLAPPHPCCLPRYTSLYHLCTPPPRLSPATQCPADPFWPADAVAAGALVPDSTDGCLRWDTFAVYDWQWYSQLSVSHAGAVAVALAVAVAVALAVALAVAMAGSARRISQRSKVISRAPIATLLPSCPPPPPCHSALTRPCRLIRPPCLLPSPPPLLPSAPQSILNMARSLFIVVLLVTGAYFLNRDSRNLVLLPIERMIHRLQVRGSREAGVEALRRSSWGRGGTGGLGGTGGIGWVGGGGCRDVWSRHCVWCSDCNTPCAPAVRPPHPHRRRWLRTRWR